MRQGMESIRKRAPRLRRPSQRGVTVIELMISMVVLAVGFGGLFVLIATTMSSNNRNSKDSSSSLLAQMVIEQISSQHPNSTATISVTDCAGNVWTIATAGGASPNGTGAALATSSTNLSYGGIDPTQAIASIPAGYAMQYVDCSTNVATTYDVRWNVMTVDGNYTRLVTASARPFAANSAHLGGRMFALPVTLRVIAGP
jgi:prepilin-type N-terminal cleavage/methylation domain-containing protein